MNQTSINETMLDQFKAAFSTNGYEVLKKASSSVLENIGKGLSLI